MLVDVVVAVVVVVSLLLSCGQQKPFLAHDIQPSLIHLSPQGAPSALGDVYDREGTE